MSCERWARDNARTQPPLKFSVEDLTSLPVLGLIRKTHWERRMVWSSSLAILLVGVVERAFF
jgi:hypothetical protein